MAGPRWGQLAPEGGSSAEDVGGRCYVRRPARHHHDPQQSRPRVCTDHGSHLGHQEPSHPRQPLPQPLGQLLGPLRGTEMVHGDVGRPVSGRPDRELHHPLGTPAPSCAPSPAARSDPAPRAAAASRPGRCPPAPPRPRSGLHGAAGPGCRRRRTRGTGRRRPRQPPRRRRPRSPSAAASAAASTAKPRPIAVARESTTRTRSDPTSSAASRAASQVPDSSRERCTDTTPVAPPASAAR